MGASDEPPPAPTATEAAAAFVAGVPFVVANNVTDCREVAVVFFLDFADANAKLPDGFEAADVQGLLGTPVPLGRAGALLTTAVCQQGVLSQGRYDEASIAITVQPPAFGTDLAPSTVDLYEFGRATSVPAHADVLGIVAWPRTGSVVEATASDSPAIQGSGRVEDAEGELYSYTMTGPPTAVAVSGTFRWWNVGPDGVSLFDYTFEADGYGGGGECSVRAGSLAAQIVGATSCSPTDSILIALPGITGITSEFRHLGAVSSA